MGDNKEHLFFLIHGLYGRQNHMETMHLELERQLPKSCLVYSSHSNEMGSTFDGVELGAMRVFQELLKLTQETPGISRISIVGYSMGGLYARYLVGMLEDCGFFAEIEPVNFVTFATPHLGTTLWKPTFKTRILNGVARVFLGPSGIDLMARGPNSVLDKMTAKNSSYMRGLERFNNLMLFCNALGDRTVRFWTSFITDKHPFSKTHESDTDLAFFEFNENKFGPFILDLNQSKYAPGIPTQRKRKKTSIPIPMYFGIGIIFIGLTVYAFCSWIRTAACKPFWKHKVKCLAKKFRTHRMSPPPGPKEEDLSRMYGRRGSNFEEDIHLAAEEMPPSEESDLYASNSNSSLKVTTSPKPADMTKPNIVDDVPRTIEFNSAMATRMNNLNSLPWKKFAVYMDHYRTHAHIIDRLKEGDSVGTELLSFFAQQVEI